METVRIGDNEVSRFILGGNPFSGFAHQTEEMGHRMRQYYTPARVKATLVQAESLGINTFIGRTDDHVIGVLTQYWDEGGGIRWFAQTCPELGTPESVVQRAADNGARGVHVHGGYVDFLLAQGRIEEVPAVVDRIHEAGMAAGIAGHNPDVFRWAERAGLPVDYYMCSYYNASHRDEQAELRTGAKEWFLPEDRKIMTELIQGLSRPVIHYKVMAAGRNDPVEAFTCVARAMREGDAVCVGVYTEDKPDMLAEDVRLLEASLAQTRAEADRSR